VPGAPVGGERDGLIDGAPTRRETHAWPTREGDGVHVAVPPLQVERPRGRVEAEDGRAGRVECGDGQEAARARVDLGDRSATVRTVSGRPDRHAETALRIRHAPVGVVGHDEAAWQGGDAHDLPVEAGDVGEDRAACGVEHKGTPTVAEHEDVAARCVRRDTGTSREGDVAQGRAARLVGDSERERGGGIGVIEGHAHVATEDPPRARVDGDQGGGCLDRRDGPRGRGNPKGRRGGRGCRSCGGKNAEVREGQSDEGDSGSDATGHAYGGLLAAITHRLSHLAASRRYFLGATVTVVQGHHAMTHGPFTCLHCRRPISRAHCPDRGVPTLLLDFALHPRGHPSCNHPAPGVCSPQP